MAGSDTGGSPLTPRHLVVPAVFSVLSLASLEGWEWLRDHVLNLEAESIGMRLGEAAPTLFFAAALALIAIRLILVFISRRMGSPPPKMMRQVISLLVWAATGGILAGAQFKVPLGSLVTTSGMMVAVVGIALKNMISDLATGLSLPVKIGDWIEVDNHLGKVVEVSWRATRLITRESVTVIIPNTHLMSKPFRNYSQPEPFYRDSFLITLPPGVTAHQAERNMIAAARQVDEVAALPFAPDVRIRGFNDRGVEWELRYYVPDGGRVIEVRYQVQRNLLRNLHYSGIELPPTTIEFRPARKFTHGHDSEEITFLRGVDLFESLSDPEMKKLSGAMAQKLCHAGRAVVSQGKPGNSLFVLKEGLLTVSIAGADALQTVVGQITPGNFFGEMSLLTGAPRGATVIPAVDSVIYEITRNTLYPLLRSRPELALLMSEVLAERQMRNAPKLEASRQAREDRKQSLSAQMFAKISTFFRLEPAQSSSA